MITVRNGCLRIDVMVKPKNPRNAVEWNGADESLVLRLTAAPVEGQANRAAVDFLSEILSCPKKSVKIESGLSSRRKRICIQGIEKEDFIGRITRTVSGH